MVILAFLLPIVVLALLAAVGVYVKVKYPSAVVFPCIIKGLCPVFYEQIRGDIEKMGGVYTPKGMWLRGQGLWREFRLNWLYLCEEANNTILFLRALRFEYMRIPATKSGMTYEDHEVLIVELLPETVELRWKQIRCQLLLVLRFFLGRKLKSEVLAAMLNQYKDLEEQIDNLTGMMDPELQRKLREALGLNWGLVDGNGESGPGLA